MFHADGQTDITKAVRNFANACKITVGYRPITDIINMKNVDARNLENKETRAQRVS